MRTRIDRLKRELVRATPDLWLRWHSVPHMLARGHLARRRIVARHVAATPHPRLQIGAGPLSLPGWLNSDLRCGDIYLDLLRPLPLPDATFAYVYGEHVIEHVTERAGIRLLRELHRIMRPGGVIRLTTPDLRKIIALYEDRNPVISQRDYARFLDGITYSEHQRGAQVLNTFMRAWGHRFVYDAAELTAKLLEAGFEDVRAQEMGTSEHPLLQDLERHGPSWENAAEAMCLEAVRS